MMQKLKLDYCGASDVLLSYMLLSFTIGECTKNLKNDKQNATS